MYPNTQAHAGETASLAEYSSKNMEPPWHSSHDLQRDRFSRRHRPLYLFPEFMATKPVELLIGEWLKVEWFNDDVLGRTLDKLYRAGPEAIFMQITSKLIACRSL